MAISKDEYAKAIAETLKELRDKARLTHDQLAKKASLSRQVIGRIESAESPPTLYTLYKLADALGCTQQAFMKAVDSRLAAYSKRQT